VKDWRREIVKRLLFGAGENLTENDEVAMIASAV
jgi:hypothetical protein